MERALYMSTDKLIERFGVRVNGGRRVPSEVVQWLLDDPDEEEMLGMVLILLLCRHVWLPHRPFVMPDFDLGELG